MSKLTFRDVGRGIMMNLGLEMVSSFPGGLVTQNLYEMIRDLIKTRQEPDNLLTRAKAASDYLTQAGQILTDLQSELANRNTELTQVVRRLEENKTEAEHWAQVASINETAATALTKEIENRVRKQIRAENERNRTARRIGSIIIGTITLIIGAVLGVFLQDLKDQGKLW